jgi:hypothetical protein
MSIINTLQQALNEDPEYAVNGELCDCLFKSQQLRYTPPGVDYPKSGKYPPKPKP